MRIKDAAILGSDGKVYVGRNHGVIIQEYGKDGIFKYRKTSTQGFITECGKFVDRVEGAKIAIAAKQCDPDTLRAGGILMSEDLFHNRHHIWCNKDPYHENPDDCFQCKKLKEIYPMDGMTPRELAEKHFPNAISRTGDKE